MEILDKDVGTLLNVEVLELMRARIAVRGDTKKRRAAAGRVSLPASSSSSSEERSSSSSSSSSGSGSGTSVEGAAATVAPKMNSKLVRERRQRDGHIAWLEDCVVEYLELSAAQTQTREHAQKFLAAVDAKAAADVRFRLSAFEKMQLVNHRPSGLVEVHLIVEDCHNRLGPEGVTELMALIEATLPARPVEEEEGEEEEEEEDEEGEGEAAADAEAEGEAAAGGAMEVGGAG